ncbi:MAG: hypothetical protein U9N13_08235 [Euryarchaeota archaeon]|nr:hypothetical protein [Euryarchaeota archaeon]
MKTYLLIWYNSEGARPSEINQRLMSMGFEPMQGAYDYVYNWGNNVDVDEILKFGDKVCLSLHNMNVTFKIETINGNE